jgi:dGTP triphosphohydrolase
MKDAVYPHVEIAHREQASRKVIHGLMDIVIEEIKNKPDGTLSKSVYPQLLVNSRDYLDCSTHYKLALRLTDYISGMTDSFAFAQYQRMNAMGAQL